MAKLINGNGNPAVYPSEDSDWFASIMGNTTAITAIGEQFRYDQADANTIEVFDGVIITKEGRRIQLDVNQVDLFEIPTGTQGDTSYYIIGYHLITDADSHQTCETFVQKMENATDTIPENTFRGGADDVYVSLYRVTQDGLNIDSIDLLLPSINSIEQIESDLADIKSALANLKWTKLPTVTGTSVINLPSGWDELNIQVYLPPAASYTTFNIVKKNITSATKYINGYDAASQWGAVYASITVNTGTVQINQVIVEGTNYTASADITVSYR